VLEHAPDEKEKEEKVPPKLASPTKKGERAYLEVPILKRRIWNESGKDCTNEIRYHIGQLLTPNPRYKDTKWPQGDTAFLDMKNTLRHYGREAMWQETVQALATLSQEAKNINTIYHDGVKLIHSHGVTPGITKEPSEMESQQALQRIIDGIDWLNDLHQLTKKDTSKAADLTTLDCIKEIILHIGDGLQAHSISIEARKHLEAIFPQPNDTKISAFSNIFSHQLKTDSLYSLKIHSANRQLKTETPLGMHGADRLLRLWRMTVDKAEELNHEINKMRAETPSTTQSVSSVKSPSDPEIQGP